MAHVYFHIDLNAFFANAEIIRDPELKGKPIVVSGSTRRSVVSTASYEARAFGIHSAMPVAEASQLCKDLIVVEGHYALYEQLSRDFISIIESYTDLVEQVSVDECYADMSEVIKDYEKPLDLAWEIQKRVLNELQLPCSIGVAPNLFLAKMASDMKKPLGITVLRKREVQEKLWPLPIKEMRGIGLKTYPYLEDIGIHTIGDLANYQNIEELQHILGKNTLDIIARANGEDDSELSFSYDMKSMGVSETFLEDVTDYDELRGLIRYLSRKLSKRLYHEKKAGYLISLRIKYHDFVNKDRSKQVDHPIISSDDIFIHAMDLFDAYWNEEPIRLLGITVSKFEDDEQVSQISLFDENRSKMEETRSVLHDLNKMLGSKLLIRASDIDKEDK